MTDVLRIGGNHRDVLGESPIWHAGEAALYWVDIRAPAVRRLDVFSDTVDSRPMPGLVGAIAFADDGRLVVALESRIALLEFSTAELTTLTELPDMPAGHRFNDGRCDPAGRFWVGTMHNITRAPEGTLYRLEPAGLTPVSSGISIPNSLAWSADGRTMYFADSLRYRIDAFPYDLATGRPGERRTFVETPKPAFPDGSAVDAEGCLWNAEFLGSRIVRYTPDGCIDLTIALPVDRPTCCAFGGADLKTLFITSTCQHLSEAERAGDPLAGALFAVDVAVPGLPEPKVRLDGLPRRPRKAP